MSSIAKSFYRPLLRYENNLNNQELKETSENKSSCRYFGIFEETKDFSITYQDDKNNPLFFKYIGTIFNKDEEYNLFTPKKEFCFYKILKKYYQIQLSKIEYFEESVHPKKNNHQKIDISEKAFIKIRTEDDFYRNQLETLSEKKIKIIQNIFPAIEPSDLELVPSFFPEERSISYTPFSDAFPYEITRQLGYGAEFNQDHANLLIAIPTAKTLQSNMQKIFDEEQVEYSVRILEGDGIFSDRDFIHSYLTHDVIVSTKEEELHDHFTHILPVGIIMKESPEGYILQKKRIQELLTQRIEKIERDIREKEIEKIDQEVLWLGLSATVDVILNFTDLESMKAVDELYWIDHSWSVFATNERYLPYLEKRFPGKIIFPEENSWEASLRAKNLYEEILQKYHLSGYKKNE